MPHRVVDRLGEDAVRELVDTFQAGTPKWRLADAVWDQREQCEAVAAYEPSLRQEISIAGLSEPCCSVRLIFTASISVALQSCGEGICDTDARS